MKFYYIISLLFLSSQVIAAGGLTIANLPSETEEANPVCHDGNGKLANCNPTAGLPPNYLPPFVKDGDGNELGRYMGSYRDSETYQTPVFDEVISDKGYRFHLSERTGMVKIPWDTGGELLVFSESNCEGQAYISINHNGYRDGYVFGVREEYINVGIPVLGLYYVPKGSTVDTEFSGGGSHVDSGGICQSGASSNTDWVPVYPNNPEVTGVANKGTSVNTPEKKNPYQLPITVQSP